MLKYPVPIFLFAYAIRIQIELGSKIMDSSCFDIMKS